MSRRGSETPRKQSGARDAKAGYWHKRVASKEFRRGLEELVRAELMAVSRLRVKDVVDAGQVREILRSFPIRLVPPEVVGELSTVLQRRAFQRLEKTRDSVHVLLGPHLARQFEEALLPQAEAPEELRAAAENVVRLDFVTSLLTDLVFTSLLAFNKRVNPLFGALAMRSMEEQVKSFIRGFLPMLQDRLVEFAFHPRNREVAEELTRSVVRQALSSRVSHLAGLVTPHQRRQSERLAREIAHSEKASELFREVALAVFDDLYAAVRERKVGQLLDLERHGKHVAAVLVDLLKGAASRNGVVAFLAAEAALAAGSVGESPAKPPVRTAAGKRPKPPRAGAKSHKLGGKP